MLTDEIVLELRKLARSRTSFNIDGCVEQYKASRSSIYKAIRGVSFSHLNTISPPVFTRPTNEENKRKVCRLRTEGKTYDEIAKILGFHKSTVSEWGREAATGVRRAAPLALSNEQAEIVKKLYHQGVNLQEIANRLGIDRKRISHFCKTTICKIIRKQRVLSDDQVIAIRNDIREHNSMHLSFYARKYNCSIGTISTAARGITFKHLNSIALPVCLNSSGDGNSSITGQNQKRPDETIINEMIAMIQRSPGRWSYRDLSNWLEKKTNRKYRPNHISTLLRSRVIDLEKKGLVRGGRYKKQPHAKLGRPSKKDRVSETISSIVAQTKLSVEDILSDDDGISDEEMARIIALEDAREQALLNH